MSAAKVVRQVSVEEAMALLDDGVQLVDVLPHETYLQEYLPGARSGGDCAGRAADHPGQRDVIRAAAGS